MSKFIDLTGMTFGDLTVIAFSHRSKTDKKPYWLCKCICGSEKIVKGAHLVSGAITTCTSNSYYTEKDYTVGKTHECTRFLFDIIDYDNVKNYKWYIDSNGYIKAVVPKSKRLISLHRLIMNIEKKEMIDHISGDKLDNRRNNLRLCTNQQNQFNSKSKGGKSKYKGVYKYKNKWAAQITRDYKKNFLGYYDNEIDAAKAYNKKAIELFGEFAYLNDI